MPLAAAKALKGLLADGVKPEDVLQKLQGAGFDIKPPEGDESYGAPAPEGVLAIGIEAAPVEGKDLDTEMDVGEDKPKNLAETYSFAAKRAMKKTGAKDSEEE
jgi:hypothetical protein